MQNPGKIRRSIALIILNIIVFVLVVVVVSNFTYAQIELQTIHQKTLYEITKHTPSSLAHIPVGRAPSAIRVNNGTNTVYVINTVDNTVSVIDGKNNTKIKDIHVGKLPVAIGANNDKNTIYVANYGDNTVSSTIFKWICFGLKA